VGGCKNEIIKLEGCKMTNYNDQELDQRIHTFLTKKMQKYPELNVKHRDSKTITMPTLSLRMFGTTRIMKAH
jgi:16S rRNA A1518/A1519 N6-dimethyltransferase RsmA/KsgA/DIM1 with predicted DNA glycosylase/AP lyase activity